ncbi:hypothetical protein HYPSUDRAFT_218407 [Hypholoma sublateritium FD-334 SS-4]|uniref:Uncharacterized protein n=1 Tax=Hypholoma sublateritium (strain FD-334 SS-4) TaxID=945553 RepID=A0A0D2NN12_HYPSF|nr:hypothetical protein HYPSUDRAFT_218407 [Hypholoma sublateritium FD-334 SS-4]
MYITSTINPMSKSDGNIAVGVFRYNKQRKFLRVSEDRTEMISLIIRAFRLDSKSVLSLHTSSLDACKGQSVEIDESAYSLMCTLLDDVEVTVGEHLDTQDRNPDTTLRPRLEPENHSVHPSDIDFLSSDADDAIESSITSRSSSLPPISVEPEVADEGYMTINAYDRDREIYESRIDEQDEEEVNAYAGRASGVTDKVPTEDGTALIHNKPRPKPAPQAADPAPLVQERAITARTPSSSKAAERGGKSRRKEAGGTDGDQRFEISITGPDAKVSAQFKTRGRHTVGKVLAAACKTFEIEYYRARLYHVLYRENEEGEEERVEIKCDVDDTMSRAGVNGNSQLFIRIAPRGEDEDDLTHFE